MDYYINSDDRQFRFAVPPSGYEVSGGVENVYHDILEIGEVGYAGNPKLRTYSFSSFFPAKKYSFCVYDDFPTPNESKEYFEKCKANKKPVRLIITEDDINLLVLIENFSYERKDGTGDIDFKLELKEYKKIEVPIYKEEAPKTPIKREPPSAPKQRTHKVVKGDTLWGISRKYYGKGELYPKIFDANRDKIKNPNLIYDGQVIVIP